MATLVQFSGSVKFTRTFPMMIFMTILTIQKGLTSFIHSYRQYSIPSSNSSTVLQESAIKCGCRCVNVA